MRYSSIHLMFSSALDGRPVTLRRLLIAAALSSSLFALSPALASEEGDGSLFRVPGEGPPYVPEYSARAGWPPMPVRGPYSHGRRDETFARIQRDPIDIHDEPPAEAAPYPARHDVYEEPQPEPAPRARAYEEQDEGHAPQYRAKIDEAHDDPGEGEHYAANDADHGGKGDGFGRLFPMARSQDDNAALKALGRAMVEESEPGDPAGDTETPAGYTFLGQLIDHDVTLDATTQLGREIRGDAQLVNARTPDLDLDNVYGGGPLRTPHLYRLPYVRVGRLISEEGDLPRADLFRTKSARYYGPAGGEAVALVGDARDDENIVISQLHAAFVAFHNRTADIIIERDFGRERWSFCKPGGRCDTQELAEALPDAVKLKVFTAAHDHVIHYYHRIIAEDFLPRVIGPDFTSAFLGRGREFFFPDGFRDEGGNVRKLYIPVEFAAAAYRFGHSQVRDAYQLREGAVFDLLSDGRDGPRAFAPVAPRYLVDWRYFFEIGHQRPENFNYSRRIDTELVRSLHRLNLSNTVGRNDLGSLAARNLIRGKTLHLPSGQAVAELVLPVLEHRGLIGRGGYGPRSGGQGEGWRAYVLPPSKRVKYFLGNADSPLWYYVLQEASAFGTNTRPYGSPENDDDAVSGGDYGPYRNRGSWRKASVRYGDNRPYRRNPRGYDGAEGGYRLGPVGATIVGEVLAGLLEHYRVTTGKGLAYEPQIRGSVSRGRYTMSNFLVDAGVTEHERDYSRAERD